MDLTFTKPAFPIMPVNLQLTMYYMPSSNILLITQAAIRLDSFIFVIHD